MARTKIENMPLGARLVGYYVDAFGETTELASFFLTVKPSRIEIHDDIITLLLSHGFKSGRPTLEVSFKRGTMVEWEIE